MVPDKKQSFLEEDDIKHLKKQKKIDKRKHQDEEIDLDLLEDELDSHSYGMVKNLLKK